MDQLPPFMPFILSELRKRRGSIPSVCLATGVPLGTVQKIINGQVKFPRADTTEKLLNHLGYPAHLKVVLTGAAAPIDGSQEPASIEG